MKADQLVDATGQSDVDVVIFVENADGLTMECYKLVGYKNDMACRFC